jgi:hypothetical protein
VNRLAGDLVDAGMAEEVASQAFVLLLLPTARQSIRPAGGPGTTCTAWFSKLPLKSGPGTARLEWRRTTAVSGSCGTSRIMRSFAVTGVSCGTTMRPMRYASGWTWSGRAALVELRATATLLGEGEWSLTDAAAAVRLDRSTLRRRLQA